MGQEPRMKIQLQRRGIRIEVILDANRATLELWPQLPMTVRLEDYQATEKIAYLPRRLLAASGLAGMTPVPGRDHLADVNKRRKVPSKAYNNKGE